jgi:hypothetical protein
MSSQYAQGGNFSGRSLSARGRTTLGAEGLPKEMAEVMARAAIERAMAGRIKALCISVDQDTRDRRNGGVAIEFSACDGAGACLSEFAAIAAAAVVAGDWPPARASVLAKPARRHGPASALTTLKALLARLEQKWKAYRS